MTENERTLELRIESLKSDLEAAEKRSDMYAAICHDVAEVIGVPGEGESSSWHDLPEKVKAKIALLSAAREPGLRWYPWVCINGHFNDHAKLAPEGTNMCATPGCEAEAEVNNAPAAPDALREAAITNAIEIRAKLNFERAERLEAAIRAHMEKSHRMSGRVVVQHDGTEHAEGDPCDLCAALGSSRKEGE